LLHIRRVYTAYVIARRFRRDGERVKRRSGRGPTIEKRKGEEKRGNRGKRDEKNTHTEGAW